MKRISDIAPEVLRSVRRGCVIPAQPLALDENRRFLPRFQRALCRYYMDAGAGGIAVGVHSTQFAIRDPRIGLFEPVLAETSRFIDEWSRRRNRRVLKVAGICGRTEQALYEAKFASANGYDAGLLSLAAFAEDSENAMLEHIRTVAGILPVIGFYLQPAVGGRVLPYSFWRAFAEIDNVLAVKMAPFNRYQTLDVVRAVAESGRDNWSLRSLISLSTFMVTVSSKRYCSPHSKSKGTITKTTFSPSFSFSFIQSVSLSSIMGCRTRSSAFMTCMSLKAFLAIALTAWAVNSSFRYPYS